MKYPKDIQRLMKKEESRNKRQKNEETSKLMMEQKGAEKLSNSFTTFLNG